MTNSVKMVWREIALFIMMWGYPPSVTEIASGCDLSRATVSRSIDILAARGMITRRAGVGRTIVVVKWPRGLEPPGRRKLGE